MSSLASLGWTDDLAQRWQQYGAPVLRPARVIADFGTSLRVAMPDVITAELSGKLAHHQHKHDIPKIGDWVGVRVSDYGHATIEVLIPRRNELARKIAGKQTVKQVIAANIDIAFIVVALNQDFSIERIQRYLYQLSIHNIEAVIVLNKADQTAAMHTYSTQVQALGVPSIVSSAVKGNGINKIASYIRPGKTAILLGSSGVGKSTITNQLLGRNTQPTHSVRASDATGMHTTVHRELFVLPDGGLLIDTPGLRELQLWGTQQQLDENYDDIIALARQCKYTSCQHKSEAGCAVQHALHAGVLNAAHFIHYQKMSSELERLAIRNKLYTQQSKRRIRNDVHISRKGRYEYTDYDIDS